MPAEQNDLVAIHTESFPIDHTPTTHLLCSMTSDDPMPSTPHPQHESLSMNHHKSTQSLSSKLSLPYLSVQTCGSVHTTACRYDSSTTRLRTRVQRFSGDSHIVRLPSHPVEEKEKDKIVFTKTRRQTCVLRWLSLILLLLMSSLVFLILMHVRDLLRIQLHIPPRVLFSTSHTTNNIPITVTTITAAAPISKRPVTGQNIAENQSRNNNKTSSQFPNAYATGIGNISSSQGLSRSLVDTINKAKNNTLSPNDTFPSPVHGHPVYLALQPYLSWHAAQLKCVHDPRCFYSGTVAHKGTNTEHNRTQPQPPRILLWMCPRSNRRACHGLGDRFRGIVSAFAYAILTQRVFLIHWPDNPHALTTAVIPGIVDWRVPSHMFLPINDEYDYINVPDGNINISTWPRIETTTYPVMKWVQEPTGYMLLDEKQSSNEHQAMNSNRNKSTHTSVGQREMQHNPSSKLKALTRYTDISEMHIVALLDSLSHLVMQSRGTFSPSMYRHPVWQSRFPSLRKWTSRQGYHINRIMLRVLFKPSPVTAHLLAKTVENVGSHFLRDKPMNRNSNSTANNSLAAESSHVAVHVRTGIDIAETKMPRFQNQHLVQGANASVSSPTFYTLVEEVVKCLHQKSGIHTGKERVFFASDSLKLKRVFAKVAAHYGINVLYTNISAIHVDDDSWAIRKIKKRKEKTTKLKKTIMKLRSFANVGGHEIEGDGTLKDSGKDEEPNEDEELARFINVFVEFFGIASGSAVVASKSEFSRLAYVMSDARWLVKMNVAKQGDTDWTACPWGV